MTEPELPRELVEHLCRHAALSAGDAERLLIEVLAWYSDTVEDFVRRRHRELQLEGLDNAAIYDLIAGELPAHRFATTALSTRQIRRLIYG